METDNQEVSDAFGAALKSARENAGIGVVEMAKRLSVTRQQVWRIESSDSLREETVRGYAEALGAGPAGAKAIMAGKPQRMAGKHKRARTVLRLADLIVAAKGAPSTAELTEFRRLCTLLDVRPEQVWEELGG